MDTTGYLYWKMRIKNIPDLNRDADNNMIAKFNGIEAVDAGQQI